MPLDAPQITLQAFLVRWGQFHQEVTDALQNRASFDNKTFLKFRQRFKKMAVLIEKRKWYRPVARTTGGSTWTAWLQHNKQDFLAVYDRCITRADVLATMQAEEDTLSTDPQDNEDSVDPSPLTATNLAESSAPVPGSMAVALPDPTPNLAESSAPVPGPMAVALPDPTPTLPSRNPRLEPFPFNNSVVHVRTSRQWTGESPRFPYNSSLHPPEPRPTPPLRQMQALSLDAPTCPIPHVDDLWSASNPGLKSTSVSKDARPAADSLVHAALTKSNDARPTANGPVPPPLAKDVKGKGRYVSPTEPSPKISRRLRIKQEIHDGATALSLRPPVEYSSDSSDSSDGSYQQPESPTKPEQRKETGSGAAQPTAVRSKRKRVLPIKSAEFVTDDEEVVEENAEEYLDPCDRCELLEKRCLKYVNPDGKKTRVKACDSCHLGKKRCTYAKRKTRGAKTVKQAGSESEDDAPAIMKRGVEEVAREGPPSKKFKSENAVAGASRRRRGRPPLTDEQKRRNKEIRDRVKAAIARDERMKAEADSDTSSSSPETKRPLKNIKKEVKHGVQHGVKKSLQPMEKQLVDIKEELAKMRAENREIRSANDSMKTFVNQHVAEYRQSLQKLHSDFRRYLNVPDSPPYSSPTPINEGQADKAMKYPSRNRPPAQHLKPLLQPGGSSARPLYDADADGESVLIMDTDVAMTAQTNSGIVEMQPPPPAQMRSTEVEMRPPTPAQMISRDVEMQLSPPAHSKVKKVHIQPPPAPTVSETVHLQPPPFSQTTSEEVEMQPPPPAQREVEMQPPPPPPALSEVEMQPPPPAQTNSSEVDMQPAPQTNSREVEMQSPMHLASSANADTVAFQLPPPPPQTNSMEVEMHPPPPDHSTSDKVAIRPPPPAQATSEEVEMPTMAAVFMYETPDISQQCSCIQAAFLPNAWRTSQARILQHYGQILIHRFCESPTGISGTYLITQNQ